jgi:hypothetical protein
MMPTYHYIAKHPPTRAREEGVVNSVDFLSDKEIVTLVQRIVAHKIKVPAAEILPLSISRY